MLYTIVTTSWSSVADCWYSFILLQAPLEVLVVADKPRAPIQTIHIINSRSFFFDDFENLYKIMKLLPYATFIMITVFDYYIN